MRFATYGKIVVSLDKRDVSHKDFFTKAYEDGMGYLEVRDNGHS
jgi:hypothetical protein